MCKACGCQRAAGAAGAAGAAQPACCHAAAAAARARLVRPCVANALGGPLLRDSLAGTVLYYRRRASRQGRYEAFEGQAGAPLEMTSGWTAAANGQQGAHAYGGQPSRVYSE